MLAPHQPRTPVCPIVKSPRSGLGSPTVLAPPGIALAKSPQRVPPGSPIAGPPQPKTPVCPIVKSPQPRTPGSPREKAPPPLHAGSPIVKPPGPEPPDSPNLLSLWSQFRLDDLGSPSSSSSSPKRPAAKGPPVLPPGSMPGSSDMPAPTAKATAATTPHTKRGGRHNTVTRKEKQDVVFSSIDGLPAGRCETKLVISGNAKELAWHPPCIDNALVVGGYLLHCIF